MVLQYIPSLIAKRKEWYMWAEMLLTLWVISSSESNYKKKASPPAAAALLASRKILKAIYLGNKKSYLSSAGSKITGFPRYFLAISRKQKELPDFRWRQNDWIFTKFSDFQGEKWNFSLKELNISQTKRATRDPLVAKLRDIFHFVRFLFFSSSQNAKHTKNANTQYLGNKKSYWSFTGGKMQTNMQKHQQNQY